jgi:hypothetical protein
LKKPKRKSEVPRTAHHTVAFAFVAAHFSAPAFASAFEFDVAFAVESAVPL